MTGSFASTTKPLRRMNYKRLMEIMRLLASPTSLEDHLQIIVDAAGDVMGCELGLILLFEKETGLLQITAATYRDQKVLGRERVPLEGNLAGLCFTQKRTCLVQTDSQDLQAYRPLEQLLGISIHAQAAAPIVHRERVLGVLLMINKANQLHYTEEDVTILETLAAQTAIAMHANLLSEQVQRNSQEAEQLDRMKTNFIAIASHELRTPLGLILGHASLLRENCSDPQVAQQINVIIESAQRLRKIIEDLGKVNKTTSEKPKLQRQAVDINRLVVELAGAYSAEAHQKHINLITDLPKTQANIQGDADKIAIVLNSLIKNALTYTDDGGHVLVSVENLPGYVKVSVVDDGIGIPAKDLPHVFERFFQVESHLTRHHSGMGIGLSVAKAMVELHGGEIWVESIERRGSNFSFLMPTGNPTGQTSSGNTPAFVESS